VGPAPEAGCRSSRRRGNLKPYTRNLSPCCTAICASAPMPCQCHVARTCRPLKLTLDLCLQRRPYRVPRLAGPCLAHTDLGVAASYAGFLRARLHLLLLCFPCLSVLWCAPVPPAVAHLRHQLAHAMCRGWPKSRPHLPRRRRTLMPHVPLRSTAPPSASPPSHATCAVALDCASLGVAALSCRVPLRLTAPFVVDAVAQECSCLQNQGCGKNQSRPDGHKWRGESRLRSTLGALVGLATILRRRSARPHEDIVPHQTFG